VSTSAVAGPTFQTGIPSQGHVKGFGANGVSQFDEVVQEGHEIPEAGCQWPQEAPGNMVCLETPGVGDLE